ncbi:MAG TPA: methylated-DNA--[protein]-cysteine S-methyltransferase [Mycobacteriales bacterium]|nr:methylated-DNA--[protein]-cysteine S-methyltransferase [Mycobacteriales bacterium]
MAGRAMSADDLGLADAATTESAPDRLTARLLGAADTEGLIDVAYAVVDAPLGHLVVAATDVGVVRVSFDPPEVAADELSRRVSPRVLELPRRLDAVRRELDEYFAGRRQSFDVALDWRLVTGPFARRVLGHTAAIPFGRTSTYADVAAAAGNPQASRATGNALGANPLCVVVPCHRVLRSGGGLGGYAGGLPAKRLLLDLEAPQTEPTLS